MSLIDSIQNHSRVFLGWEKPLPQLAVQRLFAYAAKTVPVDFSNFLIVVPTAEAGRLLREALAEYCVEGITGLEIRMPDMLTLPESESAAATAEILAAWSKTLEELPAKAAVPLLGPKFAEVRQDPEARIAAGVLLQNCRKELAADGSGVLAAARLFRKAGLPEQAERFELLEQLENNYLRRCPHDPVFLQQKAQPSREDSRRTIIVLHCPDLRGAAVKYLQAAQTRVEYWIHAPEELADSFDDYGRALPCWNKREFRIDPEEQLRITVHAEDQIPVLNNIRREMGQKIRAVGVLDPDLADAWQDHLRRSKNEENSVFFPAMRPLNTLPWTRLFCALLALRTASPSRDAVAAVLQHGFLADRQVLAQLDKLQQETIAQDLATLLRKGRPGKLQDALKQLHSWQKQLSMAEHNVLSECWNILRSIGEGPEAPRINPRNSTAELTALESLITAAEHAGGKSTELVCALFHQLCNSCQLRPVPDGVETLDAVGFLELPWYGDDMILLAGLSENALSGSHFSDPFLPEQAKKMLNLQTAEQSAAADAFRLAAMQNTANLRFLVCRYGMQLDALKPPAILMRCSPKDLPKRIQDLFDSKYVLTPPPPAAIQMPPLIPRRDIPAKRRLSVTDFSRYMQCPFTFYMQKILRTETVTGKAIELDHAQSGTILHSVIAGCDKAIKAGADARGIFEAAEAQWKMARHQFGEPPPGLLELQFSVMRDNLLYFAEAQNVWYQGGWRMIRSENNPAETTIPPCSWAEFYHKVFPEAPRADWRETIEFNGRFDRLDMRKTAEGLRELCVIDYKTGVAKTPAEKHFCTAAGLTDEEKSYRHLPELDKYWADLQLPLYILMIRHLLPDEPADQIRAAYFNLPTAYASTGMVEFTELNEDLLTSAMRCADQIARRIYGPEPIFWPPRDYRELFDGFEKLTEADFEADSFYLPPEMQEDEA